MTRSIFCIALLFFVRFVSAEPPPEDRIVFLGDSITQAGRYIEIIEAAIIAAQPNSNRTFIPLGLSSETVSGLSEPGHAGGKFPRPDLHERLDRVLEKAKPTLVVACYGMNDGIYYPLNEERTRAFQTGMRKLHDKVIATGSRIIHLTPPVFDPLPIHARVLPAGREVYEQPYQGYNEVLDAYSQWLIEMRKLANWEVIDVHGPMNLALAERRKKDPDFTFAKDGVHPSPEGQLLIANVVLEAWGLSVKSDGSPNNPLGKEILELVHKKHAVLRYAWLSHVGHKRPGVTPGVPLDEAEKQAKEFDSKIRELTNPKKNAFPKTTSVWHGFPKHTLAIAGKSVTVVAPNDVAAGCPWVWHGEFFGHKPDPDVALLNHGFHIVYMQINDLLGSPAAVQLWNQCYNALTTQYGLGSKPALVGLSRGGLYCYNWAIANPEKVSCIYGDAPVCDFKSWPGGKGKGKGDAKNWSRVLHLWGFPDEAAALASGVNPVDNLAPLAKHGVPLLHVFGDADDVVPWEENTGIVESRYKELEGEITLIRKPKVGHHPHGLDDSKPIVEFIRKHAVAP
jgi:lysophospholipase L1-like esterase